MRFYLKMIAPNLEAISNNEWKQFAISSMPGFDAHWGLQLETLLLQNRAILLKTLGVSPIDVVRSGPYRQIKNSTQQGCQIDYLVQTKTHGLFICEFKFKRREIHSEIITEMKDKLSRLKAPKGFARVPVLFHLGGVSDAVGNSGYFYRIIDIADFLEMPV